MGDRVSTAGVASMTGVGVRHELPDTAETVGCRRRLIEEEDVLAGICSN
jgi:hypothetical protein